MLPLFCFSVVRCAAHAAVTSPRAPAHRVPMAAAPRVSPLVLGVTGEYEELKAALAKVVEMQSNTALETCSPEQLADAPTPEQLRALFNSLDEDGDGYSRESLERLAC